MKQHQMYDAVFLKAMHIAPSAPEPDMRDVEMRLLRMSVANWIVQARDATQRAGMWRRIAAVLAALVWLLVWKVMS